MAASLLTAIYHMLTHGTEHKDLGSGHFDRTSTSLKAKRLVTKLESLGYKVELQALPEAA